MTSRLSPSILNVQANREIPVAYKAEFDLKTNSIIRCEALALKPSDTRNICSDPTHRCCKF